MLSWIRPSVILAADRWEHGRRHRQGWRGDGDSGGADAPNTGQAWLRLAV